MGKTPSQVPGTPGASTFHPLGVRSTGRGIHAGSLIGRIIAVLSRRSLAFQPPLSWNSAAQWITRPGTYPERAGETEPPPSRPGWAAPRRLPVQRQSSRDATLDGSDLRGNSLNGVSWRGASLRRTNLTLVNIRNADLREASLDRALLDGADLTGTHLNSASLQFAFLSQTKFEQANLSNANLQDALLDRTDFREADLRGANLRAFDTGWFDSGAHDRWEDDLIWLPKFVGARWDERTLWPTARFKELLLLLSEPTDDESYTVRGHEATDRLPAQLPRVP